MNYENEKETEEAGETSVTKYAKSLIGIATCIVFSRGLGLIILSLLHTGHSATPRFNSE